MRTRKSISLLVATALATVALAGAGSALAEESCPAGQAGTPPYCTTPKLGVGGVTTTSTTPTLALKLNAPGKVKVSGKGVVPVTRSVEAGTVKLKVKLTAAQRRLLKKKGKLVLKVKVAYTPSGGTTQTKTVKVVVKGKKRG